MKRRKLALQDLPQNEEYYESWMHATVVSHLFIYKAETSILCTVSVDGICKFWTLPVIKQAGHVQLPKNSIDINCTDDKLIAISSNEETEVVVVSLATTEIISSFDAKKSYIKCCLSSDKVVLANRDIDIYTFVGELLYSIKIHDLDISNLLFNTKYNIILSTDMKSNMNITTVDAPHKPMHLKWKIKLKTDFYKLFKLETVIQHIDFSYDQEYIHVLCINQILYIFNVYTGKCVSELDLTFIKLPKQILLDHSDHYLLIPLKGIQLYDVAQLETRKSLKTFSSLTFSKIALFQHLSIKSTSLDLALGNNPTYKELMTIQPILIGLHENRFYVFNNKTDYPAFKDHMNDVVEELAAISPTHHFQIPQELPKKVILHTSKGDITLELFGSICPKTVYNFTELIKSNFYTNLLWHRIVKGFLIQSGDPLNTGQGGQSIYKQPFEDEIRLPVNAYSLVMANKGPNTNTSQFFIPIRNSFHLNDKHTVFGKVIDGIDTVHAINDVEVDQNDIPKSRIKLIDATILN